MCYCCRASQTQAWKAGHKRECGQAAAAKRVQGELTDSHRELINKVRRLYLRDLLGLLRLCLHKLTKITELQEVSAEHSPHCAPPHESALHAQRMMECGGSGILTQRIVSQPSKHPIASFATSITMNRVRGTQQCG